MTVVNGYELTKEWKNSTCGMIAQGQKGGKSYFLKMYKDFVAPINNGALDAKTIEKNQKRFDEYVAYRKEVNKRIRRVSGEGGNIVIPSEEFIFENYYIEAAEMVKNVVSKEELKTVLAGLDPSVIALLMKTAAGTLKTIHKEKVVHSDLKPDNLLLVWNERSGNYVAKMIDFDGSFLLDKRRKELTGTIDYYSPEMGKCDLDEELDEEMLKKITEKTDIFSLGLIYHFYLSGEMPELVSLNEKLQRRIAGGKRVYVWQALINGGGIAISPKIKNTKYISLISDMLSLDPDDRPSADEVLKRLSAPDTEMLIQEPWPEHRIILDKDKIKACGIIVLEKTKDSDANKYKLLYKDGRKKIVEKDEMLTMGIAKPQGPKGFDDPWPEHNIELNETQLKNRGFISSERAIIGSIKGYNLYRADGNKQFIRSEMMLALKYAKRKEGSGGIPPGGDGGFGGSAEPWPEHRIKFNLETIRAKGYSGFTRKTLNGVNGYEFISGDGTKRFIRVEMLLVFKMAEKV